MQDQDAFCSNCGTKHSDEPYSAGTAPRQAPPPPRYNGPAQDPLASLTPRTASVLCYIPAVGWIAAVIVLAARKFKDEHIIRFHAFQGLYLFAVWLMVQWVVHPMVQSFSDQIFRVDKLLSALVIGVSIFMMVKASHDEAYVLPIIGELAQRSAQEK